MSTRHNIGPRYINPIHETLDKYAVVVMLIDFSNYSVIAAHIETVVDILAHGPRELYKTSDHNVL